MTIEHGHVHNLVPIAVRPRIDESVSIMSRCNDRLVENDAGKLVDRIAGCQLEEERVFYPDGSPRSIRYRIGGVWFEALNLLRVGPLPVEECDACHGENPACPRCGGVGVVGPDGLITRPELNIT
jgi:hypothetical protein